MEEVADEEQLYRSILASDITSEGRITSTAFNDRWRKPSVDRANLRTEPSESLQSPLDGIVILVAREVRNISAIKVQEKGDENFAIDVVPRPIVADEVNPVGNPAHAQIEAAPEFLTDSRFKKLKEALALLADKRPRAVTPVVHIE